MNQFYWRIYQIFITKINFEFCATFFVCFNFVSVFFLLKFDVFKTFIINAINSKYINIFLIFNISFPIKVVDVMSLQTKLNSHSNRLSSQKSFWTWGQSFLCQKIFILVRELVWSLGCGVHPSPSDFTMSITICYQIFFWVNNY